MQKSERKDLSGNLVSRVLTVLTGSIVSIFKEAILSESRIASGNLVYKIKRMQKDIPTLDSLYEQFSSSLSEQLGCKISFDKFPGDQEKDIPPATEGIYIICGNNTVYLHVELGRDRLELSAWLR
jgi:hypothetical protein